MDRSRSSCTKGLSAEYFVFKEKKRAQLVLRPSCFVVPFGKQSPIHNAGDICGARSVYTVATGLAGSSSNPKPQYWMMEGRCLDQVTVFQWEPFRLRIGNGIRPHVGEDVSGAGSYCSSMD